MGVSCATAASPASRLPSGSGSEPFRLTSRAELEAALGTATSIEVAAFTLAPGSWLARDVSAASDRGADVHVRLAKFTAGDGRALGNAGTLATLRAHGIDAALEGSDCLTLHLKAVVADGTAYLDDRNWPAAGPDTIVKTDDPRAVASVSSAIGGVPGVSTGVATEKRAALALEADAIGSGSGPEVDVATESLGFCAVERALAARAQGGACVRLLVNERIFREGGPQEREAVTKLEAAGVSIRLTAGSEKLAIAGDRAWAGSANATWDQATMLDWGAVSREPRTVAALEARFAAAWDRARPPPAP